MFPVPNTHCLASLGLSAKGQRKFKKELDEYLARPGHKAICDSKPGVATDAVSNLAQVFITDSGRHFRSQDASNPDWRIEPAPNLPHDSETIMRWVKHLVANRIASMAKPRSKNADSNGTKKRHLSSASLLAYKANMDDDDDDDDYASDNGLHTGVEPGFVDGKRLKTGHEIIQGTARISSQQNLHDSGAGEGSAQMGGVGTHPPVVIPDDDDDDNEIENPAMIRTEHPSEPERNNQAQAEVKAEPDIASREGARNVNEGLQNLQLATIQDVHRAEGPACKPTTPASGYPSFSTSQLNSTRVLFKLSDRTHGVAARLSSCLTFSQFYVSLVKALELQGKTHQIELITASVHWLKCSYQLKAFEEGSDLLFKLLLEEIQQWWGWKEGGKKSCTVIVEVRMKD